MEISVFYEVQDRLYNVALAGSNIIAEDFRLKRAVEGLGALAEKGKVFAALKQKCEKLLEGGSDAPAQLAACIALADAIAVTLGQNAVPEKEEKEAHNESTGIWQQQLPVNNVAYRDMQEALVLLRKGSDNTYKILNRYPDVLTDIRFCQAVADGLNGKASEQGDRFAEIVLEICGDDLKEIIKDSLDLNDESAKGRQVKVIAAVYGARENAWYQELAQKESVSQKVRLEAISAMGCSTENEDVLMELYKTEKGKIKAAALEALIYAGAKGIEPYLESLYEKDSFSTAEENLIRLSPSETGAKCVLKYTQLCEVDPKKPRRLNLIERKTGKVAEEAMLKMLKLMNTGNRLNAGTSILIRDLAEGVAGTEELIERLYAKDPGRFAGAYAYSSLLKGTLSAADLMRVKDTVHGTYREDEKCPACYRFTSEMLYKLRAIPVLNRYRLECAYGYDFFAKNISAQLPQAILDVLTDPAALKSFNATAECCTSLFKLCFCSDPARREQCEELFYNVYNIGTWEHERIMKSAIPFLEKAIEAHPSVYYGTQLYRLLPDRKGRVDLYYEFLCKTAEVNRQSPAINPGGSWRVNLRVETDDMEQMVKEYRYAKDQLKKPFSKLSKEEIQRIMRVLDELI